MCTLLVYLRALPEDSVGHKMLQKLGWKKGEGLGKGSKGITEPVNIPFPYHNYYIHCHFLGFKIIMTAKIFFFGKLMLQ